MTASGAAPCSRERELQEVSGASEELEEERKNGIHGVNTRREAFNEHEKDIQSLEDEIGQTSHRITTLSLSKHGFTANRVRSTTSCARGRS